MILAPAMETCQVFTILDRILPAFISVLPFAFSFMLEVHRGLNIVDIVLIIPRHASRT